MFTSDGSSGLTFISDDSGASNLLRSYSIAVMVLNFTFTSDGSDGLAFTSDGSGASNLYVYL